MRATVATAVLLAGCGQGVRDYDPTKGAEFRFYGREVVGRIDPVCPLTRHEDLLGKYEPIRNRFAALKRKLSGSPLATDLAIVEADEAYSRSVTLVECMEADTPDTERYLSNSIDSLSKHLGRMEAIAQQQGGA